MSDSEHSIIAPSSAGIFGKTDGCTGWVKMAQLHPETEESEDAREGTASHEIAPVLINNAAIARNHTTFADFEGKQATNGVMFTEEMFDGAKIYADDVIAVMHETHVYGGEHLGVEQRVHAKKRVHELSWGTVDASIYHQAGAVLYIWDYKFGHDIVEAFENWQGINYAAGLLEKLEINGIHDQHMIVKIRIVQPRAFHRDGVVREWETTAANLRGYINTLSTNAHIALSDKAMCRSGNHCKNCQARHGCEAALKAGTGLYEVSTKPVPIELSLEALGTQLAIVSRAEKQLKLLKTGFDARVESLIKSGENVPGWVTEQGYGHEKWTKPVKEIITLGTMMGHDLKKSEEVITPVKARELGIDDSIIKAYSEKPRTKVRIVPDNINKAKQVFKL